MAQGSYKEKPSKTRGTIMLAVGGLCAIAVVLGGTFWWSQRADRLSVPGWPTSGSAARDEAPWFIDVAEKTGLDFAHIRTSAARFYFPELLGGGAALLDYDNDGDLDVYLVQSGDLEAPRAQNAPNRLFRNRLEAGALRFEDVTENSGTDDRGYGMGVATGDYNGDGYVDIYVTNVKRNTLLHNNGDGTFRDVTDEAGVGDAKWTSSAAFLDYDRDGDLDLYVVNYVNWSPAIEIACFTAGVRDYCHPRNYDAPAADTLYRNNGDGTFADASAEAGLRVAFGNGLGVATGDFNNDGFVDIYVANDDMPNQLWINDGAGHFTDEALLSGCSVNANGAAEAGMGVIAYDLENDGDLDIFLTHLRGESNTLYANKGGWFDDTTAAAGLAGPSIPFTGFGLALADFDNDRVTDAYLVNGRVIRGDVQYLENDPYAEPNLLFRGTSSGRFAEVFPRGGTREPLYGVSRGAAFGDVDNDGRIDAIVVENGGPVRLLHNITDRDRNWIGLRVTSAENRDVIGAVVRVQIGTEKIWRQVQSAYSYCAANDLRTHFGLGETNQVDSVVVRWPDGQEEEFGSVTGGAYYELRRGVGRAKVIASKR